MSLTTSIHRDLLDATSRVALAAMLHDIGKFAERARIEIDSGRLDSHKTIYCPFRHKGGYHSHMHAAYSAVVIEDLAQDLPDLVGEILFPFGYYQGRAASRFRGERRSPLFAVILRTASNSRRWWT